MTRENKVTVGILLIGLSVIGMVMGLAIGITGIFWQLKYMSGESACRPTWTWYECPGSIDKPTAVKP